MTKDNLRRVIRYGISGVTAATVNLGTLHVATSVFGIWYLTCSVLGFFMGLGVSFTLQKFWTFRDHGTKHMHKQAATFFVIVVGNLCINTALVWTAVEFLGFPPLLAQLISGGLIACWSFFAYRFLVFHGREALASDDTLKAI